MVAARRTVNVKVERNKSERLPMRIRDVSKHVHILTHEFLNYCTICQYSLSLACVSQGMEVLNYAEISEALNEGEDAQV